MTHTHADIDRSADFCSANEVLGLLEALQRAKPESAINRGYVLVEATFDTDDDGQPIELARVVASDHLPEQAAASALKAALRAKQRS